MSGSEAGRQFYGRTTADEVLAAENVKGKRFLVTGGTSGIGIATVESLAKAGAHATFTGRNVRAAQDLITSIITRFPGAVVEFMPLNMSSFKDVKRFSDEFVEKYQKLDVLIFNAGIFGGASRVSSVDGYEDGAQVNVLSQVYLLELLRTLLVRAAPSRVVFVSSEAHRRAVIKQGHFSASILSPPPESYSAMKQYANTKLCQISLALYLQEHWAKDGMTFYSLHPGHMIPTKIGRSWWGFGVFNKIVGLFTKNIQQGASTTIYCAVSKTAEVQGGKYFRDCWPSEPTDNGKDAKFAEEVWKLSQEMIAAKVPEFVPYANA